MRWWIIGPVLWSGCGEGVEDVGGSVAEGAVGGGDVGLAAEPDDVDGGVAQGGHDLGAVAGAHAGVVLTLGDVADPVEAVLDRPVGADPAGQQPWVGIAVAQRGDRVDGFHRGLGPAGPVAPADDLDRSGAVREQPGLRGAVQIDDLDRPGHGAAVADGPVALSGRLRPRAAGSARGAAGAGWP